MGGENPEGANVKALRGVIYPFRAFLAFTHISHSTKRERRGVDYENIRRVGSIFCGGIIVRL